VDELALAEALDAEHYICCNKHKSSTIVFFSVTFLFSGYVSGIEQKKSTNEWLLFSEL